MAHFAQVDASSIVRQVIVVSNCAIGGCIGEENVPPEMWHPDDHVNCGTLEFPDTEPLGQEMLTASGFDGEFRQCSYNGNFRGCYPGQGYTYDQALDVFVRPASEEPTT